MKKGPAKIITVVELHVAEYDFFFFFSFGGGALITS
jgi:hypothetical protein